jgi:hypothetical protein
MKTAVIGFAALMLCAPPGHADVRLVSAADPSIDLAAALGRQIDVHLSDALVSGRLAKADYDGVVLFEVVDSRLCLFGGEQGLSAQVPELRDFARREGEEVCLPRAEVAIRMPDQAAPAGAPPVPFYATDKTLCTWVWRTGGWLGLWTEECSFDTGRWAVSYDAANRWFALTVNGEEPFPVLRSFDAPGGLDALLADLKAKGLVLDDAECVFAQSPEKPAPAGWTAWDVVPVGKRKADFDGLTGDEVPEPPCGELGMAVDYVGFFLVRGEAPGRAVYANLGQDGTMIDLPSLTLLP